MIVFENIEVEQQIEEFIRRVVLNRIGVYQKLLYFRICSVFSAEFYNIYTTNIFISHHVQQDNKDMHLPASNEDF